MGWVKVVLIAIAAIAITALAIYGASNLDKSKTRHTAEKEHVPTLVVDLPTVKQDDILVICNEGEYQPGFERLRQLVQIGTPAIAVPGGPMLIAAADLSLDSTLQAPKRALVEVLKRRSPHRVVLVAHDGCLYYDTVAAWLDDPMHVRQRAYADLDRARSVINNWFPTATVEVWYGERFNTSQMRFRPVPDDSLSRAREWFAADSARTP